MITKTTPNKVKRPGETSGTLSVIKMEFPLAKFATEAAVSTYLKKHGIAGGEIVKGRSVFLVKGIDKASFIESTIKAVEDPDTGVVTHLGRLKKAVRDALAAEEAEDAETNTSKFAKGENEGDGEGSPDAEGEGEETPADAAADSEEAEGEESEDAAEDGEDGEDGEESEEGDGDETPVEKGLKGMKRKSPPATRNDGKGRSQHPKQWAEQMIEGKPRVLKGSVASILSKFDTWAARGDKECCTISGLLDSNPDPTPPGVSEINHAMTVALSNILRKGVNVKSKVSTLLKEQHTLIAGLVDVFSGLSETKKAEIAKDIFFGASADARDDSEEAEDEDAEELEKGDYSEDPRVSELEEENAELSREVEDLKKQVAAGAQEVANLRAMEARVVKLEQLRQRRQSSPETPPEDGQDEPTGKLQKADADADQAFLARTRADGLGARRSR